MSRAGVRKFTYDTIFTGDGKILLAPEDERVSFTLDEIKEARRQGFAEGESSAAAEAERAVVQALQAISDQVAALTSGLEATCSSLRRDAVGLALASARAAADAAIARYPEEALLSLFSECAESLRGAPVVTVYAPPGAAAKVRERLTEHARQAGLESALTVQEGPDAVRLEWAAGAAAIDPESALAQAREAAERWLAAADGDAGQLNLFAGGLER